MRGRLRYNNSRVKGACISVKRLCSLLLCVGILLSLCACGGLKKYTADTFAFDTVISLVAYCESEEQFRQLRDVVFERIQELHKKFDIYNEYEGMNNLCTVNRLAGRPVEVDQDIADLLITARGIWTRTDGLVNVAQGKLFALWKEARETGVLPTEEAIGTAMAHGDMEDVVWKKTDGGVVVTLKDPEMALDVGAIAKGWAAEAAADAADAAGITANYVISAGGNVVARGMAEGKRLWSVGIRDPRSDDPTAHAVVITAGDESVVTSGGYERNLEVNGKRYCHIIDPRTGYPADFVLSATAICPESDTADGYSTALFLMTPEEAMAFAKDHHFHAVVIDHDGKVWDSQP